MSQPFACDGRVDSEKLFELLAVQTELEALEYKSYLDLQKTEDRVEFVKDVGAMQSLNSGGYIVIGVDGKGTPAPSDPQINPDDFDEQKVRSAVKKYLSEPFSIRTQVHEVDGIPVAVVYIGPNRHGFSVFTAEGQYEKNGKNSSVFRKGDVYCRHGSSSERWQQSDISRILVGLRHRIREEERKELGDAIRTYEQGIRGSEIQHRPIGALNWQLEVEDFDSALLAAIRADDQISVKSLTLDIISQGTSFFRHENPDSDVFEALVDRLSSMLAVSITYEQSRLFKSSLDALQRIYWSTADEYGNPLNDRAPLTQRAWLSIGARLEGLGALALRMRAWWAIPSLIHSSGGIDGTQAFSWLRHSLTNAARAGLLSAADGRIIPGAFIGFARQASARIPALHPDIPESAVSGFEIGVAPNSHDPLLDSIVQFDLIWCTYVYLNTGKRNDIYPSFSGYFAQRVAPAAKILLSKDFRQEVMPGVAEDNLRTAMQTVLDYAKNESWSTRLSDWHLSSPELDEFLAGAPLR